jgi:hypothetical protein
MHGFYALLNPFIGVFDGLTVRLAKLGVTTVIPLVTVSGKWMEIIVIVQAGNKCSGRHY